MLVTVDCVDNVQMGHAQVARKLCVKCVLMSTVEEGGSVNNATLVTAKFQMKTILNASALLTRLSRMLT